MRYFESNLGAAVVGRLLTANFLHLALTGMATYGLCLLLWHWRSHGEEAARLLIGSVLLHGIYDALLMAPELNDIGFFLAIICIAFIARWYLDLIQRLRGTEAPMPRAGPVGTLAVGLTATVSAALIVLASSYGLRDAAEMLIPASPSSVMLIAIFTNRLPEPMSD